MTDAIDIEELERLVAASTEGRCITCAHSLHFQYPCEQGSPYCLCVTSQEGDPEFTALAARVVADAAVKRDAEAALLANGDTDEDGSWHVDTCPIDTPWCSVECTVARAALANLGKATS